MRDVTFSGPHNSFTEGSLDNPMVTRRFRMIVNGMLAAVSVTVITMPTSLGRDLFWLGLSLCLGMAGLLFLEVWRQGSLRSRWLAMLWVLVLAVIVNPVCNTRAREARVGYDRIRAVVAVRGVLGAVERYRWSHGASASMTLFDLIQDNEDVVQYLSDRQEVRDLMRAYGRQDREAEFNRLVSSEDLNVSIGMDAAGRTVIGSRLMSDGMQAFARENGDVVWIRIGEEGE